MLASSKLSSWYSRGVAPTFGYDWVNNQNLDPSLTYTSGGNRMLYNSAGLLQWAPANMLLNSATLGTQSVTAVSGYSYTLSFQGTGSVTGSGGWTGTLNGAGASNRVSVAFTASTTSVTFTVTGSVTSAQLEPTSYNSPLAYNATTASPYYGPRFDYNPSTLAINGLLLEQSSTNLALYARDMTQAAWTKTNVTAALTATGVDGISNTATTLTATAGNGTVLQTVTQAATTATYAVSLKRVSGTGTINITQNGGSTWTPVTLTSNWTRFSAVTASTLNPQFGIQIVTNGDSIAADFNQFENLGFATSPIPTTTTTLSRSAESLTNSSIGGWFNATQGTMFVEFIPEEITAQFPWYVGFSDGTAANNIGFYQNNAIGSLKITSGGTGQLDTGGLGSMVIGSVYKFGASFSASGQAYAYNGNAASTNGAITMPTGINQLAFPAATFSTPSYWLRSFSYYNTPLTPTQVQTISGQL